MKGFVSKISARAGSSQGKLQMQPPKPSLGFSKAPVEEPASSPVLRKTPSSLLSQVPKIAKSENLRPQKQQESSGIQIKQEFKTSPIQEIKQEGKQKPGEIQSKSLEPSLQPPVSLPSHQPPAISPVTEEKFSFKEIQTESPSLLPKQETPRSEQLEIPIPLERKKTKAPFHELRSQDGKLEDMPLPKIIETIKEEHRIEREREVLQPIQKTVEMRQEKIVQIQPDAQFSQPPIAPLQQVMPRKPASPVLEAKPQAEQPQGLSIGKLVIEVLPAADAPLEVHKAPETRTKRNVPRSQGKFQAPNSNLKFGLGQL